MSDTPTAPDPASTEELAALRAIVEGTARHTGQEFFQSLVRHLAPAVGARYAFVAVFAGGTRVRTLAFWSRDRIADNIEWDVIGTPCEDVVRGNLCHYPAGVSQRFPADRLLVDWGVESYLGVPLLDAQGRHVGHLAVFDERPMPAEPRRLYTFRIFAARAAAELERLQFEERLRESEQRWRGLTEALPQLVWGATPDGACDYLSAQWTQYTGAPETDLLGWQWLAVLHPDDRGPTREAWSQAVAGGGPYDVEHRIRRSDGGYRWFKTRGVPVRDGGGSIVKWFGTCTDITTSKQLEEELRQVNARLDLAVRGSNVGVWDLELPAGDYNRRRRHYVNVWEQLGYDGPPAGRESALDEAGPDDRAHFEEAVRRFLAGETTEFETEIRLRHKDGPYRTMLARGAAVRDAAGQPLRMVGVIIDITDPKRAEEALRESEGRFRGTFENAAVGIAHRDLQGRFLRLNDKFCSIVGYSREELLEKTFQDITHTEDLTAELALHAPLLRGGSPSYALEKRYLRKDGSPVWAELFVSLQRDAAGAPAYDIAVVLDISERKRLEGELRRAVEAAEAANRAKDEFLANVSHEIRTPMNAILGMTDLALDTPLTEDQRQYLKTVKSAADNLLGIINDLLDFAKIEAGKLELDLGDFSLRSVAGETLRALAARANRKGLEVVCDVQPDVPDALVGDAGRLRQVLLNLVGNAIKFTEEGEVVVQVEQEAAAEPAGRQEVLLRFRVCDTGIGIPGDKQAAIFRAFEQEDASTTRKYGGTGLGLTIAARLVALMGGQISVDSAPGRGSTFAFTARFGLQPHPAGPAAAQPPVLLRNLPVLVVDDNATNRHILEEWLRGWRMGPAAAGDGVAAMGALWEAAARGRPFALVLLDARMPDTDGLALAAQVRKRAELSATRIILLSSGDRPGDWERARELRIDAHLLKPVQQDELLETICRVMSRTRGEEPREARPAAGRELATATARATAPLHVLVAEDDEFSARFMEQLLARTGHRVRLTADGREALSLAEGGGFDLLLLDIHMPGLDGFGVVGAIRERERATGGHLPVIALTARSRKEDRERCLAAGMDDFLTKPVAAEALLAAIDWLVPARSASRPHEADAGERGGLLDLAAVLSACGDDPEGLRRICQDFQTYAPARLAEVGDALRDRDAPRLRQAAHKFSPLLFAFSTAAGNVASDLEDLVARGQLEEARPLLERLESMTQELLRLVGGLSLETLRRQAEGA
jgi:PAS domain S-box-containing protein